MLKNIIIVVLVIVSTALAAIAWHNAKPICNDLIRYKNGDLVCEYNLGNTQEDKANVLIRKVRQ